MTNKPIEKSVIITGASSGIGEALAYTYATPHIHLGLTGRNKDRLERVAKICREKGAHVTTGLINVTDQKQLQTWLDKIDTQNPIDLCIANAGISAGTSDGHESGHQVREIFDINLTGVLNTIHPIMDKMIARQRGQIALMSSMAGFRGMPGAPAYCASKAAVKSYGEALRGHLKPHGVGVSVICPGFVRSRMTTQNHFNMPFFMEADKAAHIIKRGLDKNKGRIAFPFPTYFGAWLLGTLPDFLAEKIANKTPKK